jgi:hypothetical protein
VVEARKGHPALWRGALPLTKSDGRWIPQWYKSPQQVQRVGWRKRSPSLILIAHNKGFPYYVKMNVTLSLPDELVRKVRRIAAERDTTLTALIRDHLHQIAAYDDSSGRKRRERQALERSFETFRFSVGPRTWTRADLHERS